MREYTSKLIEMMEEGVISAKDVAEMAMAMAYMSENDVKDMCSANDLLIGEADEDWDECADPDAALNHYNYVGSRHHY